MRSLKFLALALLFSTHKIFAEEAVHITNEESLIFQFPAGSVIPLQLFLNGNLLQLNNPEDTKLSLYCKQTFFVYPNKEELLFSLDAVEWKTFSDFVTGTLNCCFSPQEKTPVLSISAAVDVRESS